MNTVRSTPPRGELRIYLGAAPGVGKTFAMLGEAHRRCGRDCDVVAAVVETHGRARTAELLEGIEVIPNKVSEYRGTTVSEMDLDAVLARKPDVALVDELAHTNAPGSRNAQRWQDVEELLAAGITVLSTLNVQHLESLNDVVEQITGAVQHETVPDAIVRAADQVELVDVTPEALRSRLSHGNVYAAEKVDAALSNYFRRGNLTALRELALLWVADQVDAALAKYRSENSITQTWEARERLVVAVTGGPESETLVRRASRIASKSSAELLILHVIRGDGLSGISAPQMGKVRTLAASLGAQVHSVVGDDVPATLLEFAKNVNATQLVVGTSRRSRWARIVDEGIGAAVVQRSGSIDIHMVTHEEAAAGGRRRLHTPRQRRWWSWLAAVVVPSIAAGLISLAENHLQIGGESALFFIAILAVALLGGVLPAALSALISGLLLNYFFTAPLHSFSVAEPDNFITALVLLVVAVAVAALVDAAANRTREARAASREAELLALFAGSVLRGADLSALLERTRETYGQRAVSVVQAGVGVIHAVGERAPAKEDDADTVIEVAGGAYALLLAGGGLRVHDRRVLIAVANQAVGLIKQKELTEEASKANALAEADQLRRSLLSAVSHDLRTPLAAVKVAVSSLRSTDVAFSPSDTAELLATVEESTDQLTALVGNLLDSSRLAAGVVRPTLSTVFLDEVLHRALVGTAKNQRSRVRVKVDSVAVLADSGLLERVFANLVDNALRYAPDGLVRVDAVRTGSRVVVTVADEGPGIDKKNRSGVFEAFQRYGDRDTSTGVGLGLSVVRGFLEAMGGSVSVTDTPGGGLTMVLDLAASEQESVGATSTRGLQRGEMG